jgi:hypothetical protein
MLAATLAAVTGTAAVVTGLSVIDPGSVSACAINSATSATIDVASVTSISGGTVNVVVALLTYSGPTAALDTNPKNIAVFATGYVN